MAKPDAKPKGFPQEAVDESDFIKSAVNKSASRAQSVPPKPRNAFGLPAPKSSSSNAPKEAGAVDEEQFREAFTECPRLSISSGAEVESELTKIKDSLSNPKEDWEKRVDQLKRLRGVVIAGAADYKEYAATMKFVDLALQVAVKDLRSQVVREACVTLSFMAEKLGMRFERTAELTLPSLVLLIPNSAKVMSTSGIIGIRFILGNVHSSKLVPIITNEFMTSKSKDIRRYCCEFIGLILAKFPKQALEKHVTLLQEAIKKGMADADSEARALARQAFFGFKKHFRAQADNLFKDLDPMKQRYLEEGMSRSTSQNSLKSGAALSLAPSSKIPITGNLGVECALRMGNDQVESVSAPTESKARSSSAIDMAAARRAKAKLLSSGTRTLRPPTRPAPPPTSRGRNQSTSAVSHSQPGSRSTSPSNARYANTLKRTPGHASKDVSRDSSPVRTAGKVRTNSSFRYGTQRKAAGGDASGPNSRRPSQSLDQSNYHSDDESETSSLASEHSLGSHVRSRPGNQSDIKETIPDIINQLNSGNWTTKRDGLNGLRRYIQNGARHLSRSELESICSTFTRMMNDPTTKVIGLFLDTLQEFVNAYKLELGSWSYTLITKLLTKQGADLVPTVQAKIESLFDLIRSSFPAESQFQHVVRYITDQTQTPNVRVKAAVLNFLTKLIQNCMQSSDLKNSSSSRLGVTRIINWTIDGKTPEIRQKSQQVLHALRQLNEDEFMQMVNTLDEYLREAAMKLINGYPRRPSGLLDDVTLSPVVPLRSSPMTRMSPARHVPAPKGTTPVGSPSQLSSSGNDENVNPDVSVPSIHHTPKDLQKFGNKSASPRSVSIGSTERRRQVRQHSEPPEPVTPKTKWFPQYENYSIVPVYASIEEQKLYLSTLPERLNEMHPEDQFLIFRHLHEFMPLVSESVWEEQFSNVLPFLYEHFPSVKNDLQAWSLACFAHLIKLQPGRMRQYPELTIVNILEVQKGANKTVIKSAEDCGFLASQTFPCDVIVKILIPIITTQPHPENAAAVRLFSFVAQQAPKEDLEKVLPSIVPHLVTAYADNGESNMRKECVYALIYTQLKVGEELMAPYLQPLPASKVRLLHLYLKRIVSPGESPNSSNSAMESNQQNGSIDTTV
ncbi:CLIP-associating protein 1-A-like [Paramacrobiotus metropolitanus]|uniref:CLIP-associating protein 1-A-like n=1 Tax=Paramacrobiotus metropolitanus TaxID=2943436 RepID=UPI002445C4CC|nr:CLIP-associating protein 1-A-like [Paramacrobiotus metropolitanus]